MELTAALALAQTILGLVPQLTTSRQINSVVSTLTKVIPIAMQGEQELLPAVTNIIAALSANPAATTAQLATLRALDAQVDAAFDAAVDAYMAAHPLVPTSGAA